MLDARQIPVPRIRLASWQVPGFSKAPLDAKEACNADEGDPTVDGAVA